MTRDGSKGVTALWDSLHLGSTKVCAIAAQRVHVTFTIGRVL